MTTKDQAQQIVDGLRGNGFEDQEIIEAVMNVLRRLEGLKK